MPYINLILGGARSGKSRLAEQRAVATGLPLVYLATATAGDDEMTARIRQHREGRETLYSGQTWTTIEEPLYLASILEQQLILDSDEKIILVDCLTLWLSNALHAGLWQQEKTALLSFLKRFSQQDNSDDNDHSRHQRRIIFVSNETGLGVVPMGEITRKFVDESGFLHQQIAAIADQVTLVVAGLATELKQA